MKVLKKDYFHYKAILAPRALSWGHEFHTNVKSLMAIITTHLVFRTTVKAERENFKRLNIILPYGHIAPTLRHEPLT